MLVYMMLGLAGVPIFAQFSGGFSTILSPTFGFIISFIILAFVAGKIREINSHIVSYVVAALSGLAINYVIGTNWMYLAYQFWFEAPEGLTYSLVWLWMVAPLPKDIILTVLAGIFAHRLAKYHIVVHNHMNQSSA